MHMPHGGEHIDEVACEALQADRWFNGWLYGLGFIAASAALHASALLLGRTVQAHGHWLRSSGAAISLARVWLGLAA